MPEVSFGNLLGVATVAFLAPLLLGFVPRLRVPSPVLEILAGVLLGPSVLGWVRADLPVQILAVVGLAFLLFLAGLEIDLGALRGPPLTRSVLGYAITLAVGAAIGFGLSGAGWVRGPWLLAITLSATSLGLIVPVLKDAGSAHGTVGQLVIAAASVADFAAILLLSLFFSASSRSTGGRVALLVVFAVMIVVFTLAISRAGRSIRLGDVLQRLQDTTAQIRVRATVLLLLALVALASRFGLEEILGAFVAGAVVGLLDRDSASHPHLRTKLEAIGFGFLVPVFFVTSGVRLDLGGLLASPTALARVPVLLLALLLVRGLAALAFRGVLTSREIAAAGLLQATSLPLIVTATQIGVATGRMTSVTAAGLVCAGLLSVMIFPVGALSLLRGGAHPRRDAAAPTGETLAPSP